MWGCSSVGRAPALQAGGQEFDSPYLHQTNLKEAKSPSLDSEKNHENCKIKIKSINQISRKRKQREKRKKDKITGN